MSGVPLVFMCYWGGDDEHPFDGEHFQRPPNCALRAKTRWRYRKLIKKLCEVIGVDRANVHLQIICRYPHIISNGVANYLPLNIDDNMGMNLMFDVSTQFVGLSGLQLYVIINFIDNVEEEDEPLQNEYLHDMDTFQMGSLSCYSDRGAGTSTQTYVEEEEEHEGGRLEEGEESFEEEDPDYEENIMENLNEDFDNAYLDCSSATDVSENEGEDGVGEELGVHLLAYEEQQNEGYERSGYQFYRNIGETSDIYDDNQYSYADWNAEEEICKGIRFANKNEVQHKIKLFHIKKNLRFKVKRSTSRKWTIECLAKDFPCNFYVNVSLKNSGYWEITKYKGPHSCLATEISEDHPNLDAKFIGGEVLELVKTDPELTIAVVRATIKTLHGKDVSYRKAWCGKQKAIAAAYGDWEDSYVRLPRLLAAIQKWNPGTIVEHSDPPPPGALGMFDRVFWAFGPCIEAFSYCRPVISVDGTFLHGRYKGVILIAMGVDANDSLLPLAFAVVEKEDYRNWCWFLHLLCKYVIRGREVCLISDRHGGILSTVADSSWPRNVVHRWCMLHMRANFLAAHKGDGLKDLFWRLVSTTQDRKMRCYMRQIRIINPEAVKWWEFLDARKWTLAHDGGYRYGIKTTNLSEVFNGVMKGARGMPISAIVETSFYRCVAYFQNRLGISIRALGGDLSNPNMNATRKFSQRVNDRYLHNLNKAGYHHVTPFNTTPVGSFQVTTRVRGDRGGHVQVVQLGARTCTCGKWVQYHYPCSHVLACFKAQNVDGLNYIDNFYNLHSYYKTWSGTFQPIHDEAYWNVDGIVPRFFPNPNHRRDKKQGRPRSRRLKNSMDWQVSKKKYHCGICNLEGHTRKRCPTLRK